MMPGSLGSIYGKKLIVSSAVVEQKDVIVSVPVPRRGIVIKRKRQELVPFMGVIETADAYLVHPTFDRIMRDAIANQFTETMNEQAFKVLES